MENEIKKLLKKANEMVVIDFKSAKEAKSYAHKLYQELQEQEEKLMEEKRKLDDLIWELKDKGRDVFNYWLNIK